MHQVNFFSEDRTMNILKISHEDELRKKDIDWPELLGKDSENYSGD